jgi:hypothetical protein
MGNNSSCRPGRRAIREEEERQRRAEPRQSSSSAGQQAADRELALSLSRQERRTTSRSSNSRDQYASPPRFEDLFQIGTPSRGNRSRGAQDGGEVAVGLEELFTAIMEAGIEGDTSPGGLMTSRRTRTITSPGGDTITRTSTRNSGGMGAGNMVTTHRIQLGGPGQSQGGLFGRRSQRSQPAAFGGPQVLLHSSGQEEPRLVPLIDLFDGLNMLLMSGIQGRGAPDPQDERYWRQNVQAASPAQINSLPVTQLQQQGGEASAGTSGKACMVCLGDFADGEHVRTLPCKHYYHKDCIDQWLAQNQTCPICKGPISPPRA